MTLLQQAQTVRQASYALAAADTRVKDKALLRMAELIDENSAALINVNAPEVAAARARGTSDAFVERLTLNQKRIADITEGLRQVAALSDPIGEVVSGWTRPNGLRILKKRVPLGVIGIIYESRPNVTADVAALCLKSGNAALLRGGSEAIETNRALTLLLQQALEESGLPREAISLVQDTSRQTAQEMMKLSGYIDVLIPRGGKSLIHSVVENATVPVIQTGDGNCHVFVEASAELEMAKTIAVSAKISRPSVCNSAETLLVDSAIAGTFLPACLEALCAAGVEIRGCERTQSLFAGAKPADESDWETEYNALIYAVKVVDGIEEAVSHINRYGTRHSEAIITTSLEKARYFQDRVDAAAVYVNASTRFTDGFEFGFGAEIGISNQKLHARGPLGLPELTSCKYLIEGNGQTR